MRWALIKILFKTQSQLHINVNTDSEHFKVKKTVNYAIFLQNVCAQFIKYLQKMHETQKKYYNKMHTSMKFNMKDKVFIKTQNINLLHFSCKLNHKYTDLFEIIIS